MFLNLAFLIQSVDNSFVGNVPENVPGTYVWFVGRSSFFRTDVNKEHHHSSLQSSHQSIIAPSHPASVRLLVLSINTSDCCLSITTCICCSISHSHIDFKSSTKEKRINAPFIPETTLRIHTKYIQQHYAFHYPTINGPRQGQNHSHQTHELRWYWFLLHYPQKCQQYPTQNVSYQV